MICRDDRKLPPSTPDSLAQNVVVDTSTQGLLSNEGVARVMASLIESALVPDVGVIRAPAEEQLASM